MAVGCRFPAISRLRAIFPDFGSRKFPVSGAGVRGFGCSKQLICHRYLQTDQEIFAPA
jgi:hypothetical protein